MNFWLSLNVLIVSFFGSMGALKLHRWANEPQPPAPDEDVSEEEVACRG